MTTFHGDPMTSFESPTHPDAPRAGGETADIDVAAMLKPCPFCGADEASGDVQTVRACGAYTINCWRCGARSPSEGVWNDAAAAWNRRAALPALLDRPAPSDGWQPATTAPRSGEHILITQLGRAGFGYTDGVAQDWCAVAHYWPVAGEEGFYLSAGASSEIDDHPLSFTHWMPLPVVCLCDYSLANAPGVSHQPHCPLSSRAALLERHRDGERAEPDAWLVVIHVRRGGSNTTARYFYSERETAEREADRKCNAIGDSFAQIFPLFAASPDAVASAGPSPERAP